MSAGREHAERRAAQAAAARRRPVKRRDDVTWDRAIKCDTDEVWQSRMDNWEEDQQ